MQLNRFYDYEKGLSDKKKKELGIVYTPENIVDYINKKTLSNWDHAHPPRVCDFSCGTGVFLMDMANKIADRWSLSLEEVMSKYIFGNDIDQGAVDICKKLLGCDNITVMNGLDYDCSPYDIIVANPPYVRIQKCDKETREKIKKYSWCVGDTDLYIAFLEMIVKSNKIFGLICPNSWIKNMHTQHVRDHLLQARPVFELIDFRNELVFDSVQTYCSMIFGKQGLHDSYQLKTSIDSEGETKQYKDVDNANFYLFDKEVESLKDMDSSSNFFLDHFNFNVGLATLSDKVYFLENVVDFVGGDDLLYCVKKDLLIEKGITKLCYKNGKFNRYDGPQRDRIIYPYGEDGKLMTEEAFKVNYPLAYGYLLLNKERLLKRDGGKLKKKLDNGKAKWYEYGRVQGLTIQKEKILIGTIGKKVPFLSVSDGLFISGYAISEKSNSPYTLKDAIRILESEGMTLSLALRGKPLQGGYYSINKQFFKNIKFNGDKNES